jgi:hypothetical protein
MEDRVMDRQVWEAKVMTTNLIELSKLTTPLGIDDEPPLLAPNPNALPCHVQVSTAQYFSCNCIKTPNPMPCPLPSPKINGAQTAQTDLHLRHHLRHHTLPWQSLHLILLHLPFHHP